MNEGVIASVPIGTIVFLALILFASGIGIGWMTARDRRRGTSGSAGQDHRPPASALLNAIPQAALIADREGNIRARNPRAVQLMNEARWDANLPSMLDAAIRRVADTHLTETMELAAADKEVRRLQAAVTPLEVEDEAVALILLTDPADGSSRAELYQQLVSTIAHELRTPLTAIMGHVEILNSCGFEEEALWRRSLGFVSGETDRLARLVEDLLSLSRLDRVPLRIQPINLRVAAEETVSALFELAEQNNASPILQAPTDLPRVLADPDRIRQVLLNLLDNAIKHASNNPVTIRLTPNTDTVMVEVNNRGPVIAPEDLPHIFEPFWRGRQANARGVGLGLAIVRAILDQHHISIGVNSDDAQGTTFHFSLPVARPAETK